MWAGSGELIFCCEVYRNSIVFIKHNSHTAFIEIKEL